VTTTGYYSLPPRDDSRDDEPCDERRGAVGWRREGATVSGWGGVGGVLIWRRFKAPAPLAGCDRQRSCADGDRTEPKLRSVGGYTPGVSLLRLRAIQRTA